MCQCRPHSQSAQNLPVPPAAGQSPMIFSLLFVSSFYNINLKLVETMIGHIRYRMISVQLVGGAVVNELMQGLKIAAISDTHDTHQQVMQRPAPEADIFVHAGDFTQNSYRGELRRFHEFLDQLPYEDKVVIAGNHDFVLEKDRYEVKHKPRRHKYEKMSPSEQIALLKKRCLYLEHEPCELRGLKIFGSPYQPLFFHWGFQYHETMAKQTWSAIPGSLDILVTHGPPYGVLDQDSDGNHLGCKALREAVLAKQPKVHIFGHVHSSTGHAMLGITRCYNVAVLNEAYVLEKDWTVIEL